MKKLVIVSAIAMSGLIYNTANAQIGVQVGFHFGHPRVYTTAPVVVEQAPVYDNNQQGYDDNNNDYYYLPDVNAYYNINEQCYYYFDGESWINAAYLPGEYHGFDWRNARRFEVRANRPYLHNEFYRSHYNGHVIGDWGHGYDNHFNNGYANAERFNRDNHNDGNRFNDRGFRGDDQRFNDRGRDGFNQPRNDQHFDNRNQNGFNQPQQQYREQRGGEQNFNQPQQNHGQNYGSQNFENRNQGQSAQPQQQQQQNRGQNNGSQNENRNQGQSAQPSNQNHQKDERGGTEHFSQNNNHGGSFAQRMSRF
jgi:hypothetical protein